MESKYKFTDDQDWFSAHLPVWERVLLPWKVKQVEKENRPLHILELGSWEGKSAVWLLENMVDEGGELVCVDHFDMKKTMQGRERFEKIVHNIKATGKNSLFRLFVQFTVPALIKLLNEGSVFDLIYIDASHERVDVLLDGLLAWKCAKQGAIIIFDDYLWPQHKFNSEHHPKGGIDAFLSVYKHELEVIHSEYQVFVQKKTPPFQGIVWDSKEVHDISNPALWRGRE